VRTWISSGRANLDTKAKAVGSTEWRPLGDFAEFGGGGGLPPLVGGAATGGALETNYASRGARVGAALLNAFVYFVSMVPGSIALSIKLVKRNPEMTKPGYVPRLEDIDMSFLKEGMVWMFGGLLIAILIQLLLLAFRGQNLGKLLVSARVVRADNGEPAGFIRAGLLRFIVPVIIFFVLNGFFLLGFLFLLIDFCFIFREDRRCLHDLIAGTKVVSK
jgi:uncharacterized RDD family membrane protein YckC